ncbi:MAG TPA: SDR family NAD(P)-dependent oxidoreductase [Gammaproteobacteria bacterium]|nr:SDR family NAD(P)-dependent oxidoreductase [Gammaproteobacteria bacterium]
MQNTPVALITGGSSGLGAATAQLLSEHGYYVVLLDLPSAKLNDHAQTLSGLALACDVTDAGQVEAAIAEIIERTGNIRVCVNCAGIVLAERIIGRASPMPLSHFSRVIDVNLTGTFNVMRCASFAMSQLAPINADGERGVIINTASIAAFEGQLGQAAYSASKGGVVSMTLPAARELSQFGIRVVTIAPGLFQTPMMAGMPEAAQESLQQATLFPKRLGRAEEYAQCVRSIIENPLYNGCTIRLDGGVRLGVR